MFVRGVANSASYDLVILAAGMGSRFGGLKQVEPVGPNGELIIEYSVFDACRAGFDRVVMVIRKDIEREFRASIGRRLEEKVAVDYVFQEIDDVPPTLFPGSSRRPTRTKPWGTGHAVLAARRAVQRPFAVINADDFYGAGGYKALVRHFRGSPQHALVGYPLRQTLSEFGTVSRGLCGIDPAGRLQKITELAKIAKLAAGGASYVDSAGQARQLKGDEIVSMNFWGFTPAIFAQLDGLFRTFLERHAVDPKAEFYLPSALSELNTLSMAEIALLKSEDAWFGITYREDLPTAQAAMRELILANRYPASLWG